MMNTRSITAGGLRRRWIAAALLAAGASGCMTSSVTTSDGRPMPPAPRAAPHVPDGARVNTIAVQVGNKPADTDGNGFPDLIQVEVHLISRPHPTPIYEEGSFVFALYLPGQSSMPDATPIAQWRIDPEATRKARIRSAIGSAYAFRLSLLDQVSDRLPQTAADLTCRFEPADGGLPVRAQAVYSVQLGRSMTGAGSAAAP
jgi:hypothetical protein